MYQTYFNLSLAVEDTNVQKPQAWNEKVREGSINHLNFKFSINEKVFN